jgi:hypothetical protein
MAENMQVDPADLTAQAGAMKAKDWPGPPDVVYTPDTLESTAGAIANLNSNAQVLQEYSQWAYAENQRIATMLENAARAYQKVDEQYGRAMENPERQAAVEAIPVEAPPAPPPLPAPTAVPQLLNASGYSTVPQTDGSLRAGDHGNSLKNAMGQWVGTANRLKANAPNKPPGSWEGDAADAAYARMQSFGDWLKQLSDSWHDLAEAASKILQAHEKARAAHDPIYTEYQELERQMNALIQQMQSGALGNSIQAQSKMMQIQNRMKQLQEASDGVREDYASSATFSPVKPGDPPGATRDGSQTAEGAGGTGGAGGGGGGQGGRPTGDPAAMAQKMGSSLGGPASNPEQPARDGQGAGNAGSAGGGAPSGGSGASGAGLPTGMPATGMPKSPTDPTLQPAAATDGGADSGAGGGGAGGGGGMPATPMSAAVTAETVAAAPNTPSNAGGAPASGAGGATGGGMGGGMAPMHGAGQGQQGKEKRRDPKLSPDEELYVEDRPWTEGVIGNRRRREVQDTRDTRDAK